MDTPIITRYEVTVTFGNHDSEFIGDSDTQMDAWACVLREIGSAIADEELPKDAEATSVSVRTYQGHR